VLGGIVLVEFALSQLCDEPKDAEMHVAHERSAPRSKISNDTTTTVGTAGRRRGGCQLPSRPILAGQNASAPRADAVHHRSPLSCVTQLEVHPMTPAADHTQDVPAPAAILESVNLVR
jgi:hypothetical protein